MPSVTRDRKKYGAPTIYDRHRKKKETEEIRDANFRAELKKQEQDGMKQPIYGGGGHRKLPVRYED